MSNSSIKISLLATIRWLHEALASFCQHHPGYELVSSVLWSPELGWPDETGAQVRVLMFDPNNAQGQALLQALKTAPLTRPTVALVTHHEPLMMKRLLRDHMEGYLTLDQGLEEWTQAMAHVLNDETYVPQRYVKSLMEETQTKPIKLSNREKSIARLLVSGMSHQAIAKQLHISEKTVSSHKTNILNRLGLKHLPDLVRYHDKKPFAFKQSPTKRGQTRSR